jgi:murein tripeptide amidase MpaA
MPYLNVDEVESALDVATSAPFNGIAQKTSLPNVSVDGFQTHLIKIANGSAPGRPGIYFLGGVHAREWGSADILIKFIELVENAYLNATGITIGGASYTATEIKSIVDDLDIIIFPQCNPDGRKYSMDTDGDWRKNRQTKPPNSNSGNCVGVDINRNFDFLWNIDTQWAASSTVNTTTDPCNKYTYNGSGPASEPETQNAAWVHDHFPNIRCFVDLHSFSQDILYSWGDDDHQ